jgi:hypothetical protein
MFVRKYIINFLKIISYERQTKCKIEYGAASFGHADGLCRRLFRHCSRTKQKAVEQYQQTIAEIRAAATEQFAVKVPVFTQEKRAAEGKMIEVSVRVANALYVMGFESDNKELINLLGLSDSSFYRVEDNAKLTLAQRLYELAQKHAAELVPYGYEEQKIAEIGTAIDGYKNLIAKPMDAITERKQKTTNLKELFACFFVNNSLF